jgi:hypothetical protein
MQFHHFVVRKFFLTDRTIKRCCFIQMQKLNMTIQILVDNIKHKKLSQIFWKSNMRYRLKYHN